MSSFPLAANPPAASAAPPPNLVIGIDFGTYASGFAVYKRNPADASSLSCAESLARLRVSTHDRWPDQPTPDAKTRTALLYQGDKVAAWGWTAWKRWSEMSSRERCTKPYTYLENFKLLLEDNAAEGVDTVCSLPSGVTRVQAVADYLGEMRKYLRDHLRRTLGVTLRSDEVVWCLTVPAIWSDAAKARMREAAHRAGLCIQADSRSLLLTLEPEAAVLSTVTAEGNSLSDGDVVLVLDCGGGTADATLHCVCGSETGVRLEEAAVGRGALAGGAHVDSAAWTYIHEVLGPQACDAWREVHPEEVVKMKSKWESTKRSFAGVQIADTASTGVPVACVSLDMHAQQRSDVSLPLPIALVDMLGKQMLHLKNFKSSKGNGWISADKALVLPVEVVTQQIFDPVVNRITELMHDVVEEGLRLGNNCNKVLLAGGFARSPYLQSRVRQSLREGIQVIVPEDPGAAVVKGAVLFGAQPSTVTGRRARLGYGVGIARPWTTHDAIHNAAVGSPAKWYHDEEKCYYAWDVYHSFVKHGELIHVDQVVKHIFYPLTKSQNAIDFKLFSTTSNSARYTTEQDMEELASVRLKLPSGWSSGLQRAQEYQVEAEMHFGATELSLVAMDTRKKDIVAKSVVWKADMA